MDLFLDEQCFEGVEARERHLGLDLHLGLDWHLGVDLHLGGEGEHLRGEETMITMGEHFLGDVLQITTGEHFLGDDLHLGGEGDLKTTTISGTFLHEDPLLLQMTP